MVAQRADWSAGQKVLKKAGMWEQRKAVVMAVWKAASSAPLLVTK